MPRSSMLIEEELTRRAARTERRLRKLEAADRPGPGAGYVPLPTPLTSTSFDGDAFSDTAATKIDTSAVFGAPAGIKAAMVRLIARDSGAYPQADLHVTLTIDGNLSTAQLSTRPIGDDILVETCGIVNCDSNGDFYYQLNASGVGTLDLWIQIIGYFI